MPLLADTEGAMCIAYDVLLEKARNGEKSIGIDRSTFVIGNDGSLALILRGVDPEGHIQDVESFIRSNLV